MRVVNLQPLESGGELDALLLERGFDVERLPMLDLSTIKTLETISLEPAELLVFTSAQGVRSTAENISEAAENYSVIAIGPHTADVARELHFKVMLVAEEANSAGLAEAIAAKIPTQTKLILCRGDSASTELPDALQQHGYKISEIKVYTAKPHQLNADQRKITFDAIVATSSLSLKIFVKEFPSALKSPLVVIGPKTAQMAQELGFKNISQAASPNPAAIVAACSKLPQ